MRTTKKLALGARFCLASLRRATRERTAQVFALVFITERTIARLRPVTTELRRMNGNLVMDSEKTSHGNPTLVNHNHLSLVMVLGYSSST